MKQTSFKGLYSSPLSSGDRCLGELSQYKHHRSQMLLQGKTSAGRPRIMQGTKVHEKGTLWHGNGLHMGRAKEFGVHFPPQLPLVSTPVAQWQGDPARPILQEPAQLSTARHGEASMGRKGAVRGGREASALSGFSSGKKKKKTTTTRRCN